MSELDIQAAMAVEYVESVRHTKVNGFHKVVIVVDDEAVEETALNLAAETATNKSEHQSNAKELGNEKATQTVYKAAKRMNAYDPTTQVRLEVETGHDVML